MKIISAVLSICLMDFSLARSWEEASRPRVRRKVVDPTEKRIVCYYANWATSRPEGAQFGPENIDGELCTHVLYAFATFDMEVGLKPSDPKQDIQLEGYSKFVNLKKKNPQLKLMLSVGGNRDGTQQFSKIVSEPDGRDLFIKNSHLFLKQFQFDGIDIVWNNPGFGDSSSPSDKENYVEFIKGLREELKDDYIISIAVPSLAPLIEKGYDLPELSKYVDFMNIMSYNYHKATEPTANHVSPLYQIESDKFPDLNIDSTVSTYLSLGVDPSLLNLGIPLYGISILLEDPDKNDIGSKTEDEGPGVERGVVIYNQFCQTVQREQWTVKRVNSSAVGPYAFKDKRWVSYDDPDMVRTKAEYALEKNVGGLMFWTMDMDDFKGVCGSETFPMINAGKRAFVSATNKTPAFTDRPTVPAGGGPTSAPPIFVSTSAAPIRKRPGAAPTRRHTTARSPSRSPPKRAKPSSGAQQQTPVQSSGEPYETALFQIPPDRTFYSNRDILFQNMWIYNYYRDATLPDS